MLTERVVDCADEAAWLAQLQRAAGDEKTVIDAQHVED